MKTHIAARLGLVCAILLSGIAVLFSGTGNSPAAVLTIYVAPGGLQTNDGSINKPLATLEQARDRLRQLPHPPGGAVVYIRGGVYERSSTFDLTQKDSGTAAAPIKYAGYRGETVRLVGGKRIDPSWLAAVGPQSPQWQSINPAARGNIMQIDLAAHGIADMGKGAPRAGWGWNNRSGLEVFFNSEPMEPGRWPHEGFARVATVPDGRKSTSFTYTGDGPEKWQTTDVRIGGLLGTLWFYSLIDAALDPHNRTITLAESPQYGIKPGQPFVVWNVLEEVVKPGQCFLDRQAKMLYIWPPAKLDGADIYVSTLEDVAVKLSNVSHVTFQDVTIEIARGGLLKIDGGADNRLLRCTLRNAGTFAANISGTGNGLDSCQVYNIGERGVTLSGGDRATLTPAGNFVRNTELRNWGRLVRTSKAGVHIEGVGQIVSHCELSIAPHVAIWYYGNNHVIEYNNIHHVCQESGDVGAVYSGRDWGHRGVSISHNFIHDCASVLTANDIYGIYMDDAVSAARVEGNILYNIAGTAMFNAGGRDNIYVNNLIVKCHTAHLADRRGMDIITDAKGHDCNFLEKLNKAAGGDYQKGPWAQAYPALAKIPNNYAQMTKDGFKNPGGCIFSGNLGFANKHWTREGSWGGFAHAFEYYQEVADNIPDSDPLFVNETGRDFNLRPESPAFHIKGWQKIPFSQIGIRRDK